MLQRLSIKVTGIVQGVGFRPYIYRLARRLELAGHVRNDSHGVEIEIQGEDTQLNEFLKILTEQPPPLALITGIQSGDIPVRAESGFKITGSSAEQQKSTLISPDIAVCDDCRQELLDPHDRRYHYPFINCTNCGPRYTIITDIPYDRPKTSMAGFDMCKNCWQEYENPSDRRFHAQPDACPVCGPQVSLRDNKGTECSGDPLSKVIELLQQGKIIAIKGIGGFHLAALAQNTKAVQQLRDRKHRFEKPLALMVRDIATAGKLAYLNEKEQVLLSSLQRPIVLCRKKEDAGISTLVSLDNNYLGLLLPYSPLHEILFRMGNFEALVMTSANMSEEPICYQNEECRQRLGTVADYFLEHNREIYIRCDDSVVRTGNEQLLFIRRSRGYAPRPILLQKKGNSVLAVGGHLKNCICLTRDNLAFVSQHIGDLENFATLQVFEQTIRHMQKLFEIVPQQIIQDLHPEYLSTKWVLENARIPYTGLQHHYAHILSVMAENNLEQTVIGLALDGVGYGTDGTIWGGEVLICDIHNFKRYAHFENVPMPGGDQAILQPWRMAAAYLRQYTADPDLLIQQLFPQQQPHLGLLQQMIDKKINSPLTSSCGRLFDAVAAILGLKTVVSYEGQAAIILEAKGEKVKGKGTPDIGEMQIKKINGTYLLSTGEIIPKIARYRLENKSVELLSKSFHNCLSAGLVKIAVQAGHDTGIKDIILSGGCFQNMLLLNSLLEGLTGKGFRVYINTQVPANDGGLALGQAYWGMHNTV
jgi:hydrogenase maturation protein HypF